MLAGGERSRIDTRTTSMLPARMRDSRGLRDVRIGNLSSRGMLVVCERPPSRGDYVDIMLCGHNLVGRVRWVIGRRFGVRMEESINVRAIFNGIPPRTQNAAHKAVEFVEPKPSLRRVVLIYGALAAASFLITWLIFT